MDGLANLDPHWSWLALGLLLGAAEMVVPGVFLIWLSGAAIITGLAAWLLPIPWPAQIVMFAILAIVSVFAGRQWLRRNPVHAADPLMNDRGARVVGTIVTVTSALMAGSGRVKLGDSEWLAEGPDAEPGTRMRVSGHDGTVLKVEHLH